jgi:hypothetical protein
MAEHASPESIYQALLENIQQYGWAVRHVMRNPESGAAQFSYTIGLTALGHPEFVITGMPFEYAQSFLNLAGQLVKDGTKFGSNQFSDKLTDSGAVFFIAVTDDHELGAIEQVYGQIDALQLIWPDSGERFPWQAGYNNPPSVQPLLGSLPPNLDEKAGR